MTHKIQVNGEIRNATSEETAVIELIQADANEREQQKANVQAAAISARAKLEALGLTDAEIAALVG